MKRALIFFAIITVASGSAMLVFNFPNPVNRSVVRYGAPLVKQSSQHLLSFLGWKPIPEVGRLKIVVSSMKPYCLRAHSLGFLGLLLFLGTTLYLYLDDRKRFPRKTWLFIVLLGFPYIFFWNVFRIAATMVANHQIEARLGNSTSGAYLLMLVGSNLGWVIYAASISIFFFIAFKFWKKHPADLKPAGL